MKYLFGTIGMLAVVLVIALSARRSSREAQKEGGRSPARVRFSFGHNSFRKREEGVYAADRKINRRWKP